MIVHRKDLRSKISSILRKFIKFNEKYKNYGINFYLEFDGYCLLFIK